jgi:hypothetical protein
MEIVVSPTTFSISENKPIKTNEKPTVRRYWPVPPVIPAPFEFYNVNNDVNLRKDVTTFFHNKVLKWINTEKDFYKFKNQRKHLQSLDGQMHIYKLLRAFIKRSGINWYDLRDNYTLIKKYLSDNL